MVCAIIDLTQRSDFVNKQKERDNGILARITGYKFIVHTRNTFHIVLLGMIDFPQQLFTFSIRFEDGSTTIIAEIVGAEHIGEGKEKVSVCCRPKIQVDHDQEPTETRIWIESKNGKKQVFKE